MATQWGRRETIIWPPHVPILTYTAIATALLCTCLFVWQCLAFSMTPLQRSYVSEYIRSGVGGAFKCSRVIQPLVSGRSKETITACIFGRFRRWEDRTSEWRCRTRDTFRIDYQTRLWVVLSWAETEASRHLAAPLAPASGVRRRRLVAALCRQPD
jgi:hypothetical protein